MRLGKKSVSLWALVTMWAMWALGLFSSSFSFQRLTVVRKMLNGGCPCFIAATIHACVLQIHFSFTIYNLILQYIRLKIKLRKYIVWVLEYNCCTNLYFRYIIDKSSFNFSLVLFFNSYVFAFSGMGHLQVIFL